MDLSKSTLEAMKAKGWEYVGVRRKNLREEPIYSFVKGELYRTFTLEKILEEAVYKSS